MKTTILETGYSPAAIRYDINGKNGENIIIGFSNEIIPSGVVKQKNMFYFGASIYRNDSSDAESPTPEMLAALGIPSQFPDKISRDQLRSIVKTGIADIVGDTMKDPFSYVNSLA